MKVATRGVGRLSPGSTVFFLCDIQKVFKSLIFNMPRVEQTASILSKAAGILDIPVVATEHHMKAFGPMLENIRDAVHKDKSHWFEKTRFSMCTDEIGQLMQSKYPDKRSAVVFGIETHVCVQQTSLDLLEQGYEVHLVVDGVSSQRAHDREVAIQRIAQSGAFLTTSESILFELMSDAKHPKFKELLPLFKEKRVAEFERL